MLEVKFEKAINKQHKQPTKSLSRVITKKF